MSGRATGNPGMSPDDIYWIAVEEVLNGGDRKQSRVGPVVSATGVTLKFDLRKGFPLLQHKKVPYRLVCVELAWFLAGRTNVRWLQDRNVHIWDDDAGKAPDRGFAYEAGELGPIYGAQWAKHDQIARLRRGLKEDPGSRRHVVTAWNPEDIPKMVLPPCHHTWQIVVSGNEADLVLAMRSGDMGLGVPFNIASYATLLTLLAKEAGLVPRHLVINIADAHVYVDHIVPLNTRSAEYHESKVEVDLPDNIDEFVKLHEDDVDYKVPVRNYAPGPALRLPLHT